MKIWYRVTITFTMLLVIFALLITGFQLAVYGDSHYGFYKKEYEKYRVTDDLNMNSDRTYDGLSDWKGRRAVNCHRCGR